jgi:hypothetical protein
VSKENVEVVLRLNDVGNLHDPRAEDFAHLITPDWICENLATAVTDKTYHGRAGMLEWRRDLIDVFAEGVRFEVEIVADGGDFVVVRMAVVGEGASSGAPLALRFAGVHWLACGRIRHTVGYARGREALKAVGLEG